MVVFHWTDNKSRRNWAHCAVQSPSADFELTTKGTFCEWLSQGQCCCLLQKQTTTQAHPFYTHNTSKTDHWVLFHLHTQPLYPCKCRKTSYWKPIVPVHSGSIYEQRLSNSWKHIKHTINIVHVTWIWHIRNKTWEIWVLRWRVCVSIFVFLPQSYYSIKNYSTYCKFLTLHYFYGASMMHVLNLTLTTPLFHWMEKTASTISLTSPFVLNRIKKVIILEWHEGE